MNDFGEKLNRFPVKMLNKNLKEEMKKNNLQILLILKGGATVEYLYEFLHIQKDFDVGLKTFRNYISEMKKESWIGKKIDKLSPKQIKTMLRQGRTLSWLDIDDVYNEWQKNKEISKKDTPKGVSTYEIILFEALLEVFE